MTFNLPKREAADSILGDPNESEDEIFGPGASNRLTIPILPEAPPPSPPASPLPQPQPPAVFHQPVAVPMMPAPVPPAAASGNPFAFETEAAPAPPPVSPRNVVPPPVPAAAAPVPIAAYSAPHPLSLLPEPVEELPEDRQEKKATRATRARAPATAGSGIFKPLFFAVAIYALIATLAAVYGLFIKAGAKVDPGHPLSTIPDNFGEFDPASRKKVSQKFNLDGELPANQKADMGGKMEVGQLEIQPVKLEIRPLTIVSEGQGEQRTETRPKALVLHLLIKNTSADLAIFPMDPAFTRKARSDDKPGTRLVVGEQTFYGGAIEWPLPSGRVKRKFEQQQEQDATALKPGESREYIVFSDVDPRITKAVTDSGSNMLWRIQVRRGLIEFQGKDVPVTAIIGVQFKAADVKSGE